MNKDYIQKFVTYCPVTGVVFRVSDGKPAGHITKQGYIRLSIKNKQYMAHVIAWLMYYGSWPDKQIDHINRDKKDNRISNLRLVSNGQNKQNQPAYKNNKTGIKGVSYCTHSNKYRAYISIDKRLLDLGYFYSIEEAASARTKAAINLHKYDSDLKRDECVYF